ncbi:MAG: sortase [Actinomycetota bacterium]
MTDLAIDQAAGPASASGGRPTSRDDHDVVPRAAVVLGAVGRALILTGVIVFLFIAFQLWGTNLQEARAQDGLRDDFSARLEILADQLDSLEVALPVADDVTLDDTPADAATAPTEPAAADPTAPAADPTTDPGDGSPAAPALPAVDDELLNLLFPEDGDALAQIKIPSIEVDKVVVRGVAVADLRKGPGHYSQTSLPGNPGNASIAGHRTTYGAPFNRIDELVPGDEITVTSVQGTFTYRVLDPRVAYADYLDEIESIGDGHIIVRPSAVWVLGDFGDDRLTLTACHPKLSSRQRIIVAAELVDDAVELPAWAVEAETARQAADDETQLGANGTTDTVPANDDPVIAEASEIAESDTATGNAEPVEATDAVATESAPDLDEGLSGERDAIPPAAAWMGAAVLFWFAGGRFGKVYATGWTGRLGMRMIGLVPASMCLWLSFELIDRALPAG